MPQKKCDVTLGRRSRSYWLIWKNEIKINLFLNSRVTKLFGHLDWTRPSNGGSHLAPKRPKVRRPSRRRSSIIQSECLNPNKMPILHFKMFLDIFTIIGPCGHLLNSCSHLSSTSSIALKKCKEKEAVNGRLQKDQIRATKMPFFFHY